MKFLLLYYESDKEKINKNKNDLLEVYDYRLFDIYSLCLVVMMYMVCQTNTIIAGLMA